MFRLSAISGMTEIKKNKTRIFRRRKMRVYVGYSALKE